LNDIFTGHFLANYDSSLSFEYTIDIDPAPQNELGLKSVLYKKEKGGNGVSREASGLLNHRSRSSEGNHLESFHLLETGRPAGTSTAASDSNPADGGLCKEHGAVANAVAAAPSAASAAKETHRYEVVFDNILGQSSDDAFGGSEDGKGPPEYTVTISTELNGRTVTQTVEK